MTACLAQTGVAAQLEALEAMENVSIRTRCQASGLYDHGYALCYERLGDHMATPTGPRHRLWKMRAARIIIIAAGAIERPLAFANNDTPGVMLAGAVRDYIALWGVAPGAEVVVFTNNDDAYRTAIMAYEAGLKVPAIVDARSAPDGALPARARSLGIRVIDGSVVTKVKGGKDVSAVQVGRATSGGRIGGAVETIRCDCVAMSGGWSPIVHLFSHCGGQAALG